MTSRGPTRLLTVVGFVTVLGSAGCGGEESPALRTLPAATPGAVEHADPADPDSVREGGELATREDDSAEQDRGWCGSGATVVASFEGRNSGRTVSLCNEGDLLTYVFGRLDGEPELVYSGPIVGSGSGTAVLWGEGVSSLAGLAADLDDPDGVWDADPLVSQLAESSDTNGFFSIHALTGLLSQSVYIFRRGGWEYAIVAERGRGTNDPEMAGYESHTITVRSPSGEMYYPD